MNSTNKINELIDKGNPLLIFHENYLVIEVFQELLKLELIDVSEDKIVLTSKGEEARDIGFDKIIAKLKKVERATKLKHQDKSIF